MLEGLTPPANATVYCKVDQTLQTLDEADKKILAEAIANTDIWPAKTLSKQLRLRGISMADTTLSKHRAKTCACYRR
jgi:hypothetical protein